MRRAVRRSALATLLTGGVVGVATWVVFFSPVLGVREVEITGNGRVPAEELRQAAGVRTGTPLATVDLAGVEGRVRALRAVESATVDRVWPGTLRISVVERVPAAAVPLGVATAVIDRYGVVLQQVTVAPPQLPVLRVERAAADDPATRAGLTVLRALPGDLLGRLRELRAPSPRSITLKLTDGRSVTWGDARDSARKGRVLLAALAKPGKNYDVSSPEVVTVR
ncbi:cell division protein FtsQ/DivIB [Microbispora triticiradicis]|uniref:FtsQ-type POTRA domain-containing protein n=2 Tax=Microbispora TaxID=2005 RepID=A0ABY3LZG4_9ACTN|nr:MULTISPECIES: FtsQ-type POTRA domain-containing protein [Microbispora]TLP55088.1 FtsQ-type POTRA domain-containing protein [Microbispora fusca]TYB59993.1 FtsQ-type POTRA domain-containing protein [Microbispora tritici]